jgi:BolA protein
MPDVVQKMRERLAALEPVELHIEDESARHAGHAGAIESGGGHFRLRLASPRFLGRSRTQRHRLVYDLLSDLMKREIHALSMNLLAPGE